MTVQTDPYQSRTGSETEIRERLDPVVYGSGLEVSGGHLDPATLERYRRDGYLFFEKFFSEEEVLALLEELEILKNAPGREDSEAYIQEPGSGQVRSIFEVHRSNRVFNRLARDERLVKIAGQILNSGVYIHQSRVNLKPGFRGKEFYWHSDFETWHTEDGMPRMRALSCSIALTDNHAFNGPLMVIPGSHYSYIVCAGRTPANHYKESLRKQEYGVPADLQLQELVREGGIQAPTGAAGSALFFDCNLMHGSNGNISPFPRTNAFFVYNSVTNRLTDPFCGLPPRPEHIAARRDCEILQPVPAGTFQQK